MAINFHFGLGHLLDSGGQDVLLSGPIKASLGDVVYWKDGLGSRYFKYVKNVAGATFAAGNMLSMFGDANGLTAVNNITSGSKTHAISAALTAGAFEGALCYVVDNDDAAGGAPEGELALVMTNSTTRIDFDEDFPLNTALAVNDDLTIKAKNTATLCASGDNVNAVLGAPLVAIAIDDYFWTQFSGPCRVITENTIAPALGAQAMCGATAGKVDAVGAGTTFVDIIGHFIFAIAVNDLVNDFGWINIAVDEAGSLNLSTLDATA